VAEEQPISHPVFVYAALLMALLGARALGDLYPFPEMLAAHIGNYLLWWGAPLWALTGALAAAFWRRPLPPPVRRPWWPSWRRPVCGSSTAYLRCGGTRCCRNRTSKRRPSLWLGLRAAPHTVIWGWPLQLYRAGLSALLAALVLGGQALVFRQARAVQDAPPDPVLARTSGCVGDRGARFRFANEGLGEPRRALNHPPATGGPVTRVGLLFRLYRLTI